MPGFTRMTWIPVVDQACCCCTLETFNKIHGWLVTIFSMISIVSFCVTWRSLTECPDNPSVDAGACSAMQWSVMLIGFVLGGLVDFTVTVMFLVGISQNRPGLLKPFVVVQHLHVMILINIAVWVTGQSRLPFITLPMVLPIALQIYLLVCANSLRVRMAEKLDMSYQSQRNEV